MKTIKIIDLINKRANNEEMPNEIKMDNIVYLYCEIANDYKVYRDADEPNYWLFKDYVFGSNGDRLNDEVEILDEEDEFEDIDDEFKSGDTVDVVYQLLNKIKPLIRNQKKIIEKLNKE